MNDRIQPLEIQKYINLSRRKNTISFAAGLPDLSILPIEKLKKSYGLMLESHMSSFQYQPPIESLKEKIQNIMAWQSVKCTADEILITSGAQQGIFLTSSLFLKEKAKLIIDEFVYPGFLQIANMFDLDYLPISSDLDDGIDLNHLEMLLKKENALKYLYIVCNGHNPRGTTLSTVKRKHLAYLSEMYDFIIVEDDPYGYLSFSDERFLPMRAYTSNALYMSSFSKIISPAVRTGWIVGDKSIINKLHQLKDMNDLYLSNPNHLAINNLLDTYSLTEIIEPQKEFYKKKRDCMISALRQYMKIPHKYAIPQHGLFIWVELGRFDIEKYRDIIFEKSKVFFIPASAFLTKPISNQSAMRLNFSYPSLDEIILGIKQLSSVLNALTTEVKEDYAV